MSQEVANGLEDVFWNAPKTSMLYACLTQSGQWYSSTLQFNLRHFSHFKDYDRLSFKGKVRPRPGIPPQHGCPNESVWTAAGRYSAGCTTFQPRAVAISGLRI